MRKFIKWIKKVLGIKNKYKKRISKPTISNMKKAWTPERRKAQSDRMKLIRAAQLANNNGRTI